MTDFRALAACRGLDVELFYPLGRPGSPGYVRQSAEARAVCADCPVRAVCAASAVAEGDDVAIRGGLDPAQRRALRVPLRRRQVAARLAELARADDAAA